MLAPVDKLARRGGNNIMQVEITRKCNLHCSNCTRALEFRHDTLQMDLGVFEKALQSMEGWPGVIAVFGGNPVSHSRFPEICKILARYVPANRRGLWTNNILHHGKIAAETFGQGVLNLNCHGDVKAAQELDHWFPGRVIPGTDRKSSHHAAILMDYRDFGISEAEWIAKRETCDINRNWSGIIQELDGKAYGYFCELAGTIDALTGGRNGVEVYPGWWRQPMVAFEYQVKNCCDRGCGVPLRHKGHLDVEEVYDISPSWVPQLKETKTKINVVKDGVESVALTTHYTR